MNILPMLFRATVVLDRKFRAAMQAAETHDALVFDPDRLFISDLNGGNGTIPCAKSAADAGIFNDKMLRFTHRVIFDAVYRL